MTGRFGREPIEVRRARHLVRSTLDAWGLAQEIPPFELAVSELVTNALVHGTGEVEVELTAADATVRLSVADQGADGSPHIDRRADDGGTGGWGLQLVDQVADAWGTSVGRGATQVWLERRGVLRAREGAQRAR